MSNPWDLYRELPGTGEETPGSVSSSLSYNLTVDRGYLGLDDFFHKCPDGLNYIQYRVKAMWPLTVGNGVNMLDDNLVPEYLDLVYENYVNTGTLQKLGSSVTLDWLTNKYPDITMEPEFGSNFETALEIYHIQMLRDTSNERHAILDGKLTRFDDLTLWSRITSNDPIVLTELNTGINSDGITDLFNSQSNESLFWHPYNNKAVSAERLDGSFTVNGSSTVPFNLNNFKLGSTIINIDKDLIYGVHIRVSNQKAGIEYFNKEYSLGRVQNEGMYIYVPEEEATSELVINIPTGINVACVNVDKAIDDPAEPNVEFTGTVRVNLNGGALAPHSIPPYFKRGGIFNDNDKTTTPTIANKGPWAINTYDYNTLMRNPQVLEDMEDYICYLSNLSGGWDRMVVRVDKPILSAGSRVPSYLKRFFSSSYEDVHVADPTAYAIRARHSEVIVNVSEGNTYLYNSFRSSEPAGTILSHANPPIIENSKYAWYESQDILLLPMPGANYLLNVSYQNNVYHPFNSKLVNDSEFLMFDYRATDSLRSKYIGDLGFGGDEDYIDSSFQYDSSLGYELPNENKTLSKMTNNVFNGTIITVINFPSFNWNNVGDYPFDSGGYVMNNIVDNTSSIINGIMLTSNNSGVTGDNLPPNLSFLNYQLSYSRTDGWSTASSGLNVGLQYNGNYVYYTLVSNSDASGSNPVTYFRQPQFTYKGDNDSGVVTLNLLDSDGNVKQTQTY